MLRLDWVVEMVARLLYFAEKDSKRQSSTDAQFGAAIDRAVSYGLAFRMMLDKMPDNECRDTVRELVKSAYANGGEEIEARLIRLRRAEEEKKVSH